MFQDSYDRADDSIELSEFFRFLLIVNILWLLDSALVIVVFL